MSPRPQPRPVVPGGRPEFEFRSDLDAGLLMLAGGGALGQLRWTTDPDAPAAGRLAEGQVRLAIRRVDLRPADLDRCRAMARKGRSASDPWQQIWGQGIGEVIESRTPDCPVGAILRGALHLGTHRVLAVCTADAHGVLALPDDPGRPPVRYAWTAGPLISPAIVGIDEVERAVAALRDLPHDCATPVSVCVSAVRSRGGLVGPITVATCLSN